MPQKPTRAEAYIWQGNPRRWHASGTMASYVADKRQYIYWSTPQCRNEIQIGDKAFFWRGLGDGTLPRGIIATGIVAEKPRLYSATTLSLFKHPDRVEIGEEAASSIWKTGISITEVRLRTGMLTAEMLEAVCPNLHILKMPQATVYRLDAEQCRKIEALWANAGAMSSAHVSD